MHDRVDEHGLVRLAELRHVAKVDVRDAAVTHRKDVPRVGVSVEETELEQLPQARHHATLDERRPVEVFDDGLRVGTADAVDPLHDKHLGSTQVAAYPRDLDRRVARKVGPELLDVARLERVVELLEDFLAKLVHNEFCVAAQRLARPWVEKRRERAEHVKVAQDGRLDVGALHLDRDRLAGVAQHGLVDLPQRRRRDGPLADAGKHRLNGTTDLLPHHRERLLVWEARHVVL
mmetsp:Transcript_29814/g.88288  ORF Transcript_29814/g.88288 Transcript_29814/m.88288 type:complete len:233 (-) Transcript_29814:923-1621(-)